MSSRYLVSVLISAAIFIFPASSFALTLDQFIGICESGHGECSDHPIANAYVGGALDLIAVLDEETDYLQKIYCENPGELFNVPAIIQYMQQHRVEHASQNAMIPVLQYLEENGDC